MAKSLRESVSQPTYTKGVIKSAMRSEIGMLRVWCVVEAPDDVDIYKKFLDDNVSILPSEDEDGRCSCHNVEDIVTSIYLENNDICLFGIRDCDYTRYENSYCCPQNVFLTDFRDVEMMMFSADSVIRGLEAWNSAFPKKIIDCANVVRYIGYLRIYNDLKHTSCIFKDVVKTSVVWDLAKHVVIPEYRHRLFNKFVNGCDTVVTECALNDFITENKLDKDSYLHVCRGHDMIRFLSVMMINTHVYTTKDIMLCMVAAYSMEDFANTQLYKSIKDWGTKHGFCVLKA